MYTQQLHREAAIMSFLSEDFIYLGSHALIAKHAIKVVEYHRDLRNSSILDHTVQSFFSTKMQDEDVLTDHTHACEQKHTCITEASRSDKNQSLYRHFRAYVKSE